MRLKAKRHADEKDEAEGQRHACRERTVRLKAARQAYKEERTKLKAKDSQV
jgi:hypothetical protein